MMIPALPEVNPITLERRSSIYPLLLPLSFTVAVFPLDFLVLPGCYGLRYRGRQLG